MEFKLKKDSQWNQKMRTFFSTFPWKRLFSFLVFLLLAFIFWLMLFFRKENVEGTYRLPIKYINVPNDVVFNNPLPQNIEVKVADYGSVIFKYDLMRLDTLEVDVTYYKENNISNIQGNQFIHLITGTLSSGTKLLSYYPAIIPLETSKLEQKELSLIFDGEITTSGSNLVSDSITFIPDKVTAYASAKALSQISGAETEYTVFENLRATSQLKIKLKKVEGVKFIPNEVEIFIPINEYTEQNFDIPITCTHLPKNLDVKFFPSQVNVVFSTTLEDYKKITPEDFEIELDYMDFRSNEDGRVQIDLTQSPSSIINPRISPTTVEFLFEKRD